MKNYRLQGLWGLPLAWDTPLTTVPNTAIVACLGSGLVQDTTPSSNYLNGGAE